jgi:hypothetical protein
LQAAKFKGKPKENTGYGLIKLGAGNYGKPYIDFFFNNTQSKNTLFGIHFKHLSSRGKIKLSGGDKVEAPFSDNSGELFVKHFFRNSILSFNGTYNRDGFNYYGFPVDPIPEQLKKDGQNINLFGTKQAFSKGGFKLSLENTSKSVSAPKIGFDLDYHYFSTKTQQKEHFVDLMGHVSKPVNNLTAMLDAGAAFYIADNIFNTSTLQTGKRQEIWFKANPSVKLENKIASLKAGGKVYIVMDNDKDVALRFAPDVLLNISPVKGILNFFAGIDGKYEHNSYSKIAYENPFVNPNHDIKNSMHQYRFFGGIKGKFSSKTNYKASVEYASIKDQPFYYLQAFIYPDATATVDPTIANNDFKILYDDLGLTKVNIEIYHTATEKLNLLLTGNYYSYSMETQNKAWNLPNFDAKLSVGYKVTDQLEVSSEIFLIGERTGLIADYNAFDPLSSSINPPVNKLHPIDMIIDLNAKATYSITQDFSVFVQLNNFGFQSYERWLGYPAQGFNFLGGISYSF